MRKKCNPSIPNDVSFILDKFIYTLAPSYLTCIIITKSSFEKNKFLQLDDL